MNFIDRAVANYRSELVDATTAYEKVQAKLRRLRAERSAHRLSALFIYARGRGAMSVAGKDTAADVILDWAGARNSMTAFSGYRPLTPEAVVQAQPDVIVVTTRGLESLGGIPGLLQAPGVALTPAGKEKRIVAIDDLKLLGFGRRIAEGVRELAESLETRPTSG